MTLYLRRLICQARNSKLFIITGNRTEFAPFASKPYYTSQNTYPPRYYQQVAVNRTMDAIAKDQNRILLVMATGTGKTYTAFQIVYRLLQSGIKQKILYLADRNNLVDQTISGDFKPLEKVIHKINFAKDDRTTITSHQVYFSLYQQLVGNKPTEEETDEETLAHYKQLFDKDFFDLIIVDECHRGSAKEESRWRKVLEYFSSATQIGMTATPKETAYISNIDYFGEPIYKYSLKEGIDDGFLAPFKVIRIKTDIDDEWRPRKANAIYMGMKSKIASTITATTITILSFKIESTWSQKRLQIISKRPTEWQRLLYSVQRKTRRNGCVLLSES